jgi:AAA+ superfamily predicted ATPase
LHLTTHLHVRTPVVWVVTDEAARVVELVAAASPRPVFRMDAIDGFCRWDKDKEIWERQLVDAGEGQMAPTRDLNDALPVVAEQTGTLILEHAHDLPLAQLVSAFVERFRRAAFTDTEDIIPAQLILCSYKDEVPPAVARLVAKCELGFPSQMDLGQLAARIGESAGLEVTEEVATRSGRAMSGLSEAEAICTVFGSLAEKSDVNPDYLARAKLDAVRSGGVLEVRSPKVSLDDVGGMDQAKELFDAVRWLWEHPTEAKKLNVIPPRRILLVGLQGGGKSLMAEAVAASLQLDLAKGGISQAMSKWVGESEANVRRMFRQLKVMAPIVFWVDELGRDASGGSSSNETDGGTTDRAHGEFLTGLQELPEDVYLLAAANRIDHLPPEMTRADRFDKIMFVGFPTEGEREEIFKIHLGSDFENFDVSHLAKVTPFYTGAEIKALVRDTRFSVAAREHRMANTDDITLAAPAMKGRTAVRHKDAIATMYERAKEEWEWASSKQEAEADEVLALLKGRRSKVVPHVPNFDE